MTQKYLDDIVKKAEAKYLLTDVSDWCSHRPLLYLNL